MQLGPLRCGRSSKRGGGAAARGGAPGSRRRGGGCGGTGSENGAGNRQWHDILTRIAEPLSVNWDRLIDGETPEQCHERQERELAGQREALRLLAQ